MFVWALANWRIIALVLAVLSVLGALWAYGHGKYRQGWDECTVAHEKRANEDIKTNRKIGHENSKLSDPDIDSRIIAKWLRGS